MEQRPKVYFNGPQMEAMLIGAFVTVIVAGRRIGKSFGIAAVWLLRNMERMPRGTIGIVSATYKMALSNTLPGLLSAWESWGMIRGVHYMVGVKPTDRWFIEKPIIEPASWDNVLSLPCGSIACIVSQDRPGSANSKTFDALLIDEARFIDVTNLKNEIFPANGGTKRYFGHQYYHHSILIISDMPSSSKGSWFMDYEKEMDVDLIDLIKGLIAEISTLQDRIAENRKQGILPSEAVRSRLKSLHTDLCRFRRKAVFYKEYSSIENIEVLGIEYIKQMKRDLTPLIFRTSILCRKPTFLKDGFYGCLTEKHLYTRFNNSYLVSLQFNMEDIEQASCLQDGDLNTDQPICIAMDFNANISWIVSGQYEGSRRINVLKSYYVTYQMKLRELVRIFCRYNRDHLTRQVVFYYDSTALGRNAGDNTTYYYIVSDELVNCGWSVLPVYIGKPMEHIKKHLFINQMFKGQGSYIPYVNEIHNDDLVYVMKRTGIRNGKKDKSEEKKKETSESPLQRRTDVTDALDTLLIGMEKFPQDCSSGLLSSMT